MEETELLLCAFKKACIFLREHPPADICWHDDANELVSCIVNGKSDPEGERWMLYFVNKVLDDMENK